MAKWAVVAWWIIVPMWAFGAAALGTWLADRDIPVVQIKNEIITKDIARGESVITRHEVNRLRLCYTLLERTFFDSERTRWTVSDVDFQALGPLGPDVYQQGTPLPKNIALGPATLQMVISWRCNPVQHYWPIRLEPVDFHFVVTP